MRNMSVYFRSRRMSIDCCIFDDVLQASEGRVLLQCAARGRADRQLVHEGQEEIKIAHEFKVFADTRTSLNVYDRVLRKFVMFFLQSSLKSCEWTT